MTFQSTLPHGERLRFLKISYLLVTISIHAPAWGATESVTHRIGHHRISIHAPAWGATCSRSEVVAIFRFQSTLPHGERRVRERRGRGRCRISIHAPAWGATAGSSFTYAVPLRFQSTLPHGERRPLVGGRGDAHRVISIHAPAWGATEGGVRMMTDILFQSTLPHGERRIRHTANQLGKRISIHAPAWGATNAILPSIVVVSFQSTLPHGERRAWRVPVASTVRFQSTLPHGERLKDKKRVVSITNFNPRSRMGSDHPPGRVPPQGHISIHAPAWGATATTDSIFRYVDDIIRYCEQCAAAVAY